MPLKMSYEIKRFDSNAVRYDTFFGLYENDLMEIETRCFEESIQETWESKKELIEKSDIALFVFADHKIIGEAYVAKDEAGDMGNPEYDENKDAQHLAEVFDRMRKEGGIYFMSFAVLPEYQGQGIGKDLIQTMFDQAKKEGFRVMYTHANEGTSEYLFIKLGGEFIEKRVNWFDTGHDHSLYRIPL